MDATVTQTQVQSKTTVEFDEALLKAADLAYGADATATRRITKAVGLILADKVTDMTRVTPQTWQVRSATEEGKTYTVVSNGQTRCNCPDYQTRSIGREGYACKHIYSVLLVRKARTLWHPQPRMRHAYSLLTGEEGTMAWVDGKVKFHAGGHKASVLGNREDYTIGPYVDGR